MYAVLLTRQQTVSRTIGDQQALATDAFQSLAHYAIVCDDDDAVSGMVMLADGWYDAADTTETPSEFAARLFAEAQTATPRAIHG